MMNKRQMHNQNSWKGLHHHRAPSAPNHYFDKGNEKVTLIKFSNTTIEKEFNKLTLETSCDDDAENIDFEQNMTRRNLPDCRDYIPARQNNEPEFSDKYISIFWDLASCSPSGYSINMIVKHLQDKFIKDACKLAFTIISSVDEIRDSVASQLHYQGVEIYHAPHTDVGPLLTKIIYDQAEEVQNLDSVMYCIVMITNNIDIVRDLSHLMRGNKLILCCSEVVEEFFHLVHEVHNFHEVCIGPANSSKRCLGIITGYFQQSELDSLKRYLNNLFVNYGFVRKIIKDEAIIQFPNFEAALEAKDRFDGRRVRGHKIFLNLEYDKRSASTLAQENKGRSDYQAHETPNSLKRTHRASSIVFIRMKFSQDIPAFDYHGCLQVLRKVFGVDFNFELENFAKIHDRNEVKAEVVLGSMNKARQVVKIVEKWNASFSNSFDDLSFVIYASTASDPSEFENKSTERRIQILHDFKRDYLDAFKLHEIKNMLLKDSLDDIKEKLDTLDVKKTSDCKKANTLAEEMEVVSSKIKELKEQEEEFKNFASLIFVQIDTLEINHKFEAEIVKLFLSFVHELNCFKNGLPIYAKRSFIIDTIKNNPVCVLLAETGSGKSTQLVQYLYQCGLHQGKLIACTQPRKIAVTSLATHVSSQMGSSVGLLVGYKTGLKTKTSNETCIVYMTDHTLLNECLKDPLFSNYSCIIIDEAHERSIDTDLLLGMLKNCLALRRDLKVIITSATIDPTKFVNYFSDASECPTIVVPGRIFPVEIKYLPQEDDFKGDYMNEALQLVRKIHKEEEKGDILVFLTSPLETERSAAILADLNHDGKLLILQLHGRLQMEEQQRVFKAAPLGKRKVVFATNSAETSITIPGIRYVIDSGVAEEKKFDPKTNRSCLLIGPVSKSSADQRKGRAGRMEPGKCFRLYSKGGYDNLESSMLPEILRVNLGQAILKLMELGVKDPLNFDFVEAPSLDALVVAMEELKALKAVENGCLSTLGANMAKLPLEPRLAKLVLLGLESEIPFEALIVASISSSSGIYFRVGSEEDVHKSDLKRMESSMPEGDLITMLNIFTKWWEVEEKKKGVWCRDNWLNGKALKNSRELIGELEKIISKEFDIKVDHFFTFDKDAIYLSLKRMIFSCFFNNLCIFSGHEKTGYITLNDYQLVQVHPSSALSYLGKLNLEYIVYDQQMTTSRDFILNVTPVLSSWVEEFIQEGLLNLDRRKIEELRLYKQTFGPFGSYVLKKHILGSKARILLDLEETIKEKLCTKNVRLEADIPKGEINAYVPVKSKIVEDILKPVIELGKGELKKAAQTLPSLSHDQSFNMQGILVEGFQINDILLQGEYREIIIRNIPEFKLLEDVTKELESYGGISHFFERIEKDETKSVVVAYLSPQYAKKAVEAQREDNFLIQPRGKLYSSKASSSSFKMKMSWVRNSKSHGFLTFANDEHHNIACMLTPILKISTDHPDAPGPHVTCMMQLKGNRQSLNYNLAISQIPEYITSNDLKHAVGQQFPNFGIKNVFVVCERAFVTSSAEYEVVLNNVKQEFAQLNILDEIEINLLKPKDSTTMWVAFLFFEKANHIQSVFKAFNRTQKPFSNHRTIVMQPQLQVKIFLNQNIFNVIKEPLEEFMKSMNIDDSDTTKKRTLTVEKGKKTKDKILIFIDTNNLDDLCKILGPVSELSSGQRLTFQNTIAFKALKTTAWGALKQIQTEFGVFIQLDFRSTSLSIFGKSESVQEAAAQIKNLMIDLEDGVTFEISLSQSKGLLKSLILTYGPDLSKLIEETALKTIKINVNRHRLIGTGSREAHSKLCDIIQTLKEGLPPDNLSNESEETCPICLMDVLSGISSYRLQYCGHLHCIECINAQIQQKIVPFICSVESCGEMFVLEDFKFLLDANSQLYQDMVDVALREFVAKNSDRVNFCPVANCPAIFRICAENTKYFCQACKNDICTRCKVLYHHGISCEPSLTEWLQKDPKNRKLCPKCSAPIEKIDGCDHMVCSNCKADMCWLCLKTFESSLETYAHIPLCHLNYYDVDLYIVEFINAFLCPGEFMKMLVAIYALCDFLNMKPIIILFTFIHLHVYTSGVQEVCDRAGRCGIKTFVCYQKFNFPT